jgi:hypothetical protein
MCAALFYIALLLPGLPFALAAWKIIDDMEDVEDLQFYLSSWFLGICFLLFLAPAIAIGKALATFNSYPCYPSNAAFLFFFPPQPRCQVCLHWHWFAYGFLSGSFSWLAQK